MKIKWDQIPTDFIINDLEDGKLLIEATYEVKAYHFEGSTRVIEKADLLYFTVIPVSVKGDKQNEQEQS